MEPSVKIDVPEASRRIDKLPPPILELDPLSVEIGPSGIEPFYWPVARDEIAGFSRLIAQTMIEVLRGPLRAGDEDAELLYTVSILFLYEGTSMFAAQLLANRLARDGVTARIPPAATHWRAAIDGVAPPDTLMVRVLRNGAPRPASWRRRLRPLRGFVERDGFARRPIELVDFERDIVCVTLCPLTGRRVKETRDRVVICPLNEWFFPPHPSDPLAQARRGASAPLRDHLIDRLAEGSAARDARLSPTVRSYLRQWFDDTTGWVRYYRDRALRRPERIPRRLWRGTNGIIWSRILAGLVKASGGEVTGHDHAFGANYAENTLVPFAELQAADTFVTFTRAHVDLYERTGPSLLVDGKMPRIEHVGPK